MDISKMPFLAALSYELRQVSIARQEGSIVSSCSIDCTAWTLCHDKVSKQNVFIDRWSCPTLPFGADKAGLYFPNTSLACPLKMSRRTILGLILVRQ
jgi:hypothetical protein